MATSDAKQDTGELKTNFLRQFRDSKSKQFKKFTAAQFSEVWNHYDTDGKSISS